VIADSSEKKTAAIAAATRAVQKLENGLKRDPSLLGSGESF
jgi:hypothetical protein